MRTSSSDRVAHATDPSQPSLGTLWIMKSSPYSRAVRAVTYLSRRVVTEISFIPFLSSITMWFRLLFTHNRPSKVTIPILKTAHPCNQYIYESLDIAIYIDSKRDAQQPTLFPPERLAAITAFTRHAHALTNFMRAKLTSILRHDLQAAQQLYMPLPLRNRFFSVPLLKVALFWFARKYSVENREATRAVARKGLEAVRAALASCSTRHLRYLCGDSLTYADIVVAESIYFDPERYGKFGYVYSDEQFFDEFTDVVAWARAVRSTHYASLVASRKAGS